MLVDQRFVHHCSERSYSKSMRFTTHWIPWALAALLSPAHSIIQAATHDMPISETIISVVQSAASLFPRAHQHEACSIITITGLGIFDSDYSLINDPTVSGGKPSWIGTTPDTQDLLLSWQPLERVWTIGVRDTGLYNAFVPEESGTYPPRYSSRWRVFNPVISYFEDVSGDVSVFCPACTAVAISNLPDDMAACNGPYRTIEDIGNSIFVWSHVVEESCMLVHDGTGRAIVTTSSSMITACLGKDVNLWDNGEKTWESVCSQRLLLGVEEGTSAGGISGGGASVTCTSAGSTTRLAFRLSNSRTMPSALGHRTGHDGSTQRDTLAITSVQHGSIVSTAQGSVHLVISRDPMALLSAGNSISSRTSLSDVKDESSFSVDIMVDAEKILERVPLKTAREKGFLVSLRGVEGTHFIELCLRDNGDGASVVSETRSLENDGCIADTALSLEAFPTDSHIVQGRSSVAPLALSATPPPTRKTTKDGFTADDVLRVAFVVDLEVVDGYKLSSLYLMKNLPPFIQASGMDLSCASGALPMMEIFEDEDIPVARFCTQFPRERWEALAQQPGGISRHLYSVLVNATDWADVTATHPSIARALAPVHDHLGAFDTLVMSNGAKDDDAYLLELARLAGINGRVVNLGAITGGYMSRFFHGATAFVAPSHYVAYNPAVIHKAGGVGIKVCHPVMDASRILTAIRSCPSFARQDGGFATTSDAKISNFGVAPTAPSQRALREGDRESATFTMVGRLSPCKTPGMFVRAMSILRRRDSRRMNGRAVQGKLVGVGRLRRYLETMARELDAGIEFTGFLSIDDVPCDVVRATALVLPSLSMETFGMVAPEAMILGVPVITFGFGGTGELVRHMVNGIVIDEPTPRALADAMELLAQDAALQDRLGKQARLDARRAMSLEDMVACHAEVLSTGSTKR